jgi:hypothetical protein
MASTALNLFSARGEVIELAPRPAAVTVPRKLKKARPVVERTPRKKASGGALSVVAQIRRAFEKKRRFATYCGLVWGGFVPVATCSIVHFEVAERPYLWLLVLGGLLYSALTVYQWSTVALRSKGKALGFVILAEGVLTLSNIPLLTGAALALLIVINGIATGANLSNEEVIETEVVYGNSLSIR